MALGANRAFPVDSDGCLTNPVQVASKWVVAIDSAGAAAGVFESDANPLVNPDTIDSSTRHILKRNGMGTQLRVRMSYLATTITTQLKIVVFGRTSTG